MSIHRYFPHSDADISAMLDRCGHKSLDELYSDVAPELRLRKPYELPEEMSETEVRRYFESLFRQNRRMTCFAGGGFYDHYTPAVIDAIISRSEFLTAYTPYQPEISQGTLQYIFEYQSMMASLTGLDVSNASMYDGATATAEAMLMAVSASRKKKRVLISATVNPAVARVVSTYARYHGVALEVIPDHNGETLRSELEAMLGAGDVAGVIAAYPNYYGIVEDYSGWGELCHSHKALFILNCRASALGILKSPGSLGADIACGDAQSLGMPLNYGGPGLGFLCTTNALVRKMPGRIVGQTTDADGRRVFVLTLQAREQHIRREKATSNICSNQGLMALHTVVYLSLMGNEGLRQVNDLGYGGLRLLAEKLEATGMMKLKYPDKPFIDEAVFEIADGLDADTILEAAAREDILAGIRLDERELLVAVTEMQTPADIERYANLIASLKKS